MSAFRMAHYVTTCSWRQIIHFWVLCFKEESSMFFKAIKNMKGRFTCDTSQLYKYTIFLCLFFMLFLKIKTYSFKISITDQHRVQMSNTAMNGVSQVIVRVETCAATAILEQSSSFIQKFINQQNVMMCKLLDIALVAYFVHSLILTVSIFYGHSFLNSY